MRILMTADSVGGVWDYSLELIRGLHEYLNASFLLVVFGQYPSQKQLAALERTPGVEMIHKDFKLEWMPECEIDVEHACDWLSRTATEYQPDLIHANSYSHACLSWKPTLLVCHSSVCSWFHEVKSCSLPEEYSGYRKWVRRSFYKADSIVFPSNAFKRIVSNIHGHIPKSRVILNGRDANVFQPGIKQPFIFAAGRLWDEAKNLSILSAHSSDFIWPIKIAGDSHLPGESPYAEHNVQFLGFLSQTEMADALTKASIFISPAKYEPFGLAVLEAALSGCALVLSDIPTFRDLWDGVALFADSTDGIGLAEITNELISKPDFLRRMALKARTRALSYDSENMIKGYAQEYCRLVQGSMHENAYVKYLYR